MRKELLGCYRMEKESILEWEPEPLLQFFTLIWRINPRTDGE